MMDCPKCHKDMVLEEYETTFSLNDTAVTLREEYWCPECSIRTLKRTYYKETYEEFEEI